MKQARGEKGGARPATSYPSGAAPDGGGEAGSSVPVNHAIGAHAEVGKWVERDEERSSPLVQRPLRPFPMHGWKQTMNVRDDGRGKEAAKLARISFGVGSDPPAVF